MRHVSNPIQWKSFPEPHAFISLAEALHAPMKPGELSLPVTNDIARPFLAFKILDYIQMDFLPKLPKDKNQTKFFIISLAVQKYQDRYDFKLNEENYGGQSRRFGRLFEGAKIGFEKKFFAIILNIIWDNYEHFSIFKYELSGIENFNEPVKLDDYSREENWVAAALLQLHYCFGDGRESAKVKQALAAPPIRKRTSERIAARKNDLDLALQRIAYDKRVQKGYVSYRELRITELPRQIFDLKGLSDLHIGSTDIKSVPSLEKFEKLKKIDCSYTLITNINFLRNCKKLESVFLASTFVKKIDPLKSSRNLKSLHIGNTLVSDLSPLQGMKHLRVVHCEDTPVSDLEWIRGCKNIRQLKISNTKITDLSPILDLPYIEELFLTGCHIKKAPSELWAKESLQRVYMSKGSMTGVDPIYLSEDDSDNCRDRIADCMKVRDQQIDFMHFNVFVLGNGLVGKTQTLRVMRGDSYDERIGSTHGMERRSQTLLGKGEAQYELKFWDFGGQHIYHGIHTLFLKYRAIYIIAWNPDHESGDNVDQYGYSFTNRPLSYWIALSTALGGNESKQIHVRTKIDTASTGEEIADEPSPMPSSYAWPRRLAVSSKVNPEQAKRGLLTAIEAAIESIRLHSSQRINRKWIEVIHEIQIIKEKYPEKWFITISEFSEICDDREILENIETILHYLDRSGFLIFRKNISSNIIINVEKIVDGIYAIVDRKHGCFDKIKNNNGNFSLKNIAGWIWNEKYTHDQQVFFINLMEIYGICFASHFANGEIAYTLPTALRDRPLNGLWNDGWHSIPVVYGFKGLHDGFIQTLICRFGRAIRIAGDYWQTGLQVTIAENDYRFQLICERDNDLNGLVKLEIQFMHQSDRRIAQGRLHEFVDLFEQHEQATGMYAETRPSKDIWVGEIDADPVFLPDQPLPDIDCGIQLFKKIQSVNSQGLADIGNALGHTRLGVSGSPQHDYKYRMDLISWAVGNGMVDRLEENVDRILAGASSASA